MNDHEEHIGDLERHEAWLRGFAAPTPDPLVVARIKYVVRTACGECHDSAPEARAAMVAAKAAVGRELAAQHVPGRSVWRLAVPMLACAAAVGFGVFRLAVDQPAAAVDPTLIVFVETMARSPDGVDLSLLELGQDVDDLGDDNLVMNATDWNSDWNNGMDENLDSLTDALSQLEQM